MNSHESAPKRYSLPCMEILNIDHLNFTVQRTPTYSKRKPKLIQNHKVIQKLFNVKKHKMEEFTFAKPKRSLSYNLPDNE